MSLVWFARISPGSASGAAGSSINWSSHRPWTMTNGSQSPSTCGSPAYQSPLLTRSGRGLQHVYPWNQSQRKRRLLSADRTWGHSGRGRDPAKTKLWSIFTAGKPMTMTRSEKSVQLSLEAWPYRHVRRGHENAKESLLELMWLALLFARTHC